MNALIKHPRTSVVLLGLLMAATTLAVVPSADAHYCVAGDPARHCGSCFSSTGLFHWHRYLNGATHCASVGFVQIGAILP